MLDMARRKLNTESFIKEAMCIHGNKYSYINVEYNSWKSKVRIICSIHGEFEQSPSAHIGKQHQGCPTCGIIQRAIKSTSTTENFIERSKKIHDEHYDYTNTIYENCDKKVTILCKTHGEFLITPSHHLKGVGCTICGTERSTNSHRKSHDEFIKNAKDKHDERYDYSKSKYVDMLTRIIIICSLHGEFYQTPASHLSSNGCKKCGIESRAMLNRKSTDHFIKRAITIHNNLYDYSLVNYKCSYTYVTIICKIHGEFQQRASCHLSGYGCSKCGIIRVINSMRSTLEEFIEKAIIVHGDKYNYNKSTYINNTTYISIICKFHGEFQQTPHSHLSGSGCPKCITTISKISTEWIGMIKSSHPLIQQEYRIPSTLYVADAYDPVTNTIYEFHGDYWHGNPQIYDSNVINERSKLSMGELYMQTITKKNKCIKLGYRYIEIWESDWKKFKKIMKHFQKRIHHNV